MLHIILIEPRIPQNTGNIGRLCVAANATLHLIHPLGFCLSEKSLKRAGLDYWQYLHKCEWDSVEHFWRSYPLDSKHFFLTTKAHKPYYHARFDAGLDYWQYLHKCEWDSVEHFWRSYPLDSKHFFLTTKAHKPYYHARFDKECFLYFGREDGGISEKILQQHASQCLTIPMAAQARSLNLATSVGIVAYEAIRQLQATSPISAPIAP